MRNSPLGFCPKLLFILLGKEKRRVVTKRGTHRAAVTLTAVRPHGKLRLDSVSAHLPTGKWARRSGERIRKESTVGTFLAWRSFGTFLSTGREKYIESITLINPNLNILQSPGLMGSV